MKNLLKIVSFILLVIIVIIGIKMFFVSNTIVQINNPIVKFKGIKAAQTDISVNSTQAAKRPNILLLMAEDMSSRVGAFGDEVASTPNLDALASEGVRYTNVFTTAGVCSPSRAGHILGVHQISTGTQHMRSGNAPDGGYYAVPPANVKAYPELLRAAGYYTYTDNKLDYQFSTFSPNSGPFTIWDAEGITGPQWRERAQGQPFFAFRNFQVTHESGLFSPLGNMPKSAMHFITQLGVWVQKDRTLAQLTDPNLVKLPPYYPDTTIVRQTVARQYDNIAVMDDQVGDILAQLEADGLANNTIVIWTTDHGDGLPRAKRELYDSGIKVPMIIRWPEAFRPEGVDKGGIDKRLISFVDLAPTILKLAGVASPEFLQGQDFGASSSATRDYIYASRDRIDGTKDRQRAVRDSRFKYIRSWHPEQMEGHKLPYREILDMVEEMQQMNTAGTLTKVQKQWYKPVGEERLFDLESDPFEINNIVDNPNYKDDLNRMRSALKKWQLSVDDWSNESEAQMLARFQPDGKRQITPVPKILRNGDVITLLPADEGHSIGFSIDDGNWQLYTKPFKLLNKQILAVKSVRYGWEESKVTIIQ